MDAVTPASSAFSSLPPDSPASASMSSLGLAAHGGHAPREEGEEGLVLDFDPTFETLREKKATVRLEWEDIRYSVGGSGSGRKEILKGLYGEASPGEVVAIMGPSGAGKTTLLNVLAGRITGGHGGKTLTGALRANGELVRPSVFRKRVAYVTQEDALFATSTAREALEFSARLRLPRKTTPAERAALVDDMLESLGLLKVQNTMIGSELIRGLSGGEKKRVAIGVELVSAPNCLFLDEPTSGLDSYSAWKVLRILNAIAQTGCTILCSIHQPSSEVFNEFSTLILLGQGHVIFQGAIADVDGPFRAKRMGVPPRTNVADHVMLLIQTRPLETLPNDDRNVRRHPEANKPSAPVPHNKSFSVMASFSSAMSSNNDDMSKIALDTDDHDRVGIWTQARFLAVRELRSVVRDKAGLMGRFGGTTFLNVLFAVLFLHVGDTSLPTYTTQSHFGALVQVFIGGLFGAAQPALLTFPLERIVFVRERGTNTYQTTPYVFAKLLVELPLTFLTALLTYLVAWWAIGFGGNFFYETLALAALMLAATSTAYILGAAATNARAALELGPIVLVPQILFLGFFIQINQMPIWLQWVQYLVATKYALNLAMLSEFDPARAPNPAIAATWQAVLTTNDISMDMAWFYALLVFLIFAGFRFVSLLILNWRARKFE